MKKRKENKKITKIFVISIILVFIFGIVNFIYKERKINITHKNLIDTTLSQYSDKNITLSARETNPKFKHLTFETPPSNKHQIFSHQIASVFRSVRSLIIPNIKNEKSEIEYGSWIWTPVPEMSSQYVENILNDAKRDKVNVIYMSLDSYLDTFTMQEGPEKEKQKKAFSQKVEDFVVRANYKNIEVDAEAGWRNWAEEDNIYKAFTIINFVKDFNQTHQYKFRGFQYDVEPYLLDSYNNDKASVLKNFIELVDKTEYFLGKSDLRFSVVIPDFYDEKDEFTPKFSYNNKKESVFKHLLKILERRKNSSIIIMSYRNFAEGEDGSIEVSNNEMQTVEKGNYNTKIIIAQEVGDVPPPYITFHNTSKKYFNGELEKINNAFDSHPNFGGIAVHYVNAFLDLK